MFDARLSVISALRALPTSKVLATDFEAYLEGKLSGVSSTLPWLDALSLDEVTQMCLWVGTLARKSFDVPRHYHPEDDASENYASGFPIISGGYDDLGAFLDTLLAEKPTEDITDGGGTKAMGNVGRALAALFVRKGDDFLVEFRSVLASAVARAGAASGRYSIAFGVEMPKTGVQSVTWLANKYGFQHQKLRKDLAALGVITEQQRKQPCRRILLDEDAVRPILEKLKDTINTTDSSERLGLSMKHMLELIKASAIQPALDMISDRGSTLARYSVADVDGLFERASTKASLVPTVVDPKKFVSVPMGAMKAGRSVLEVMQLLLDGKLNNCILTAEGTGFQRIFLDVEEIRRNVRRDNETYAAARHGSTNFTALGAVTLMDAARLMPSDPGKFKKLVAHLRLPTVSGINPVNMRGETAMEIEVLAEFLETYVSLSGLAMAMGITHQNLGFELGVASIQPEFTPVLHFAKNYRRSAFAGTVWECACEADLKRIRAELDRRRAAVTKSQGQGV